MNKPLQNLSNVREEEQRQIMEELARTGECFLCQEVIARVAKKYPGVATLSVHEGNHWFIKNNDFPYSGTKLHVLVVPKRHVTELEDLSGEEFLELQQMFTWINKKYDVEGASMFLRYGNMNYNGATLSHIHFHILHGASKHDGGEAIRVKLGYK